MKVLTHGTWQSLNKGEGLRFDANQPHGYRNLSSDVAVIHNIIYHQK